GGAANALLWGDSFAAHYVPGLQSNRDAWSHNILQYTAAQCAPVFGWDPFISPNCAEFNDHVLDVVEKFQIETVIVAADWNAAFGQGLPPGGITATVRSLSALGLKVIVIGQSPVFRPNIEWLAARGLFDDGAPIEFDKDINTRILQQSSGAVFIDPLPFLCDDTTCRYRTAENSHFSDSVHLSVFGSEWLVAQFLPLLRGVL
ncbi:MAG: SGNH hydrolase domain-containing protein, partial [Alphaproteobacteria bacterium]|nr:SGNH hydrolase domain-containing protein [Alphaproteobacteria bacterium]